MSDEKATGKAKGGFFAAVLTRPLLPAGFLAGQDTPDSCVPACVRMLICDLLPDTRNEIVFSESYLRAAFQTTAEGSAVSQIPEILRKAGIGPKYEYRRDLTPDDLHAALNRGLMIARVYGPKIDDAHVLIVEEIRDGWVGIRDPLPVAQGSAYRVREEDFLHVWLSPSDGRGRAVIVLE